MTWATQSGSSPSKPAPIAMEYERGSVVLLYGTGKEAGRHHRREAEVQDVLRRLAVTVWNISSPEIVTAAVQ